MMALNASLQPRAQLHQLLARQIPLHRRRASEPPGGGSATMKLAKSHVHVTPLINGSRESPSTGGFRKLKLSRPAIPAVPLGRNGLIVRLSEIGRTAAVYTLARHVFDRVRRI
jgi:hypothetical protein